jgi:hypothetical protein
MLNPFELRLADTLRSYVAAFGSLPDQEAASAASTLLAEVAKLATPITIIEGKLTCPHCNGTEFEDYEDVLRYRKVALTKGILYVENSGQDNDEGSESRLSCQTCFADFAYPDGVNIEYVTIVEDDDDQDEEEEAPGAQHTPVGTDGMFGCAKCGLPTHVDDAWKDGGYLYCSSECMERH